MELVSESAKQNFYSTFNTDEKSVLRDIETIKEWMKTQKHLPEIMADNPIRNFLHLTKFSVEVAKEKIDMYYTMRSLVPEFFPNPNSKALQELLEDTYMGVHPKLFNGTNRIHFVKVKKHFRANEVMGVFLGILEMRLFEDFMDRDIIIMDWENMSMSDIKQLSPLYIQKCFRVHQKIYSLRFGALCYCNCPSFASNVVTILKSVLKPKIFERIKMCETAKVLEEFMSKEDLPTDYGGSGPSLESMTQTLKENLKKYKNRFDQLENLKVDESLRPVKLNNDELLGFHGNFKKIDID